MPNAGSKKHLREKTERMDAREFAQGYLVNTDSIESALRNAAKHHASAKAAADRTEDRLEKKHYSNVAGFWANVSGLIIKEKKSREEKK